MKYIAMLITVALAFIAGTQVSSAKSFNIHAALTHQNESSLLDSMASEWLVPDSANRMMAYHNAFKK
ncbi:MAG: hypothetical protein Q9M82_04410 [Mariprofundus sp.]|nr:hypothetical protein [Mariprofundus sp.]